MRLERLYGPRGWTYARGIAELVAPFTVGGRYYEAVAGGETVSVAANAGGVTVPARPPDYLPFAGLTASVAQQLLEALPPQALRDRQNGAPPAQQLLQACAQSTPEREVELVGYLIGPNRTDERISIEGLVYYRELPFRVSRDHSQHCQCLATWTYIQTELGLTGAQCAPDELYRYRPMWRPGSNGWWLWWD